MNSCEILFHVLCYVINIEAKILVALRKILFRICKCCRTFVNRYNLKQFTERQDSDEKGRKKKTEKQVL